MRTEKRTELVLGSITRREMSVQQISEELGITYSNAYYTLQNLKHMRKCHIQRWQIVGAMRPVAYYVAGEGVDAPIRPDAFGVLRSDLMSVDRALRTAVAMWVNSNTKENEDDKEQ